MIGNCREEKSGGSALESLKDIVLGPYGALNLKIGHSKSRGGLFYFNKDTFWVGVTLEFATYISQHCPISFCVRVDSLFESKLCVR